jgi:pilus assembly protein CpaF
VSFSDRIARARRDREVEPRGNGERPVDAPVTLTDVRHRVHDRLLSALGPVLYENTLTERDLTRHVHRTLHEVLGQQEVPLTTAERARIAQDIADDVLGYGPLEPLLRDPSVTEIMVNTADAIFVERDGRIYQTPTRFVDEAHLRRTIDKIVGQVGRRVDEASPMVDARLPDGSRVNAVIPPLAIDGSLLTIRKFSTIPYTLDDLVAFQTLSPAAAKFLQACVQSRVTTLVSGGAGAGKTTLLGALSAFIPADERVITIEDAAELQLHQHHVLRLEARPPNVEGRGEVRIRHLVRNALRMRPDRIIVGEIRDAAALDMLQAMNTGHEGSICTVHANSPRDVLSRVETMVLMAGVDLPVRAIREQVASAIDLIVHLTRFRDGSRRVTHITEVTGITNEVIDLRDVFRFEHYGFDRRGSIRGELVRTDNVPRFVSRFEQHGIASDPEFLSGQGGL